MIFTTSTPETWVDLQNYVCRFLNEAGYTATSPCEIETVRGPVEVDVLVESPDELIKKIICECKFWNTAVPKEKVHAFRTVVGDSGASLGLLISKSGFQSGALEAAKYSNVMLLTWDEFTKIIEDKWILTQLIILKKVSAPLSVYTDPLDIPYEQLSDAGKATFDSLCKIYWPIRVTCWQISKTKLLASEDSTKWYAVEQHQSIEDYIRFLLSAAEEGVQAFHVLFASENIRIPAYKFKNADGYTYMYLN